jgi:hypothetical protein
MPGLVRYIFHYMVLSADRAMLRKGKGISFKQRPTANLRAGDAGVP